MHITTETAHPQHVVEVDGVGLTETARDVVEALCRVETPASTGEIRVEANSRDRQEAWRSLRRLQDAGVVDSREADVDLEGTARKPRVWWITEGALQSAEDVVERLRRGEDVPLDPVEEREQRLAELERRVNELAEQVGRVSDRLEVVEADREVGDAWGDIDPAED